MTDPRPTQNAAASPLSEERVREIQYELATIVGPTGWRWSKCYEITNEIGVTEKHWALTNDESDARGIVVSGWLVLAATEPRDYDGRPLDQERHLRFIANAPTYLAELLADRTALTARLEAVERERDELARDKARIDAIERGEIEIDFMGTTTRYFNVYRPDGDLSTTADGTSLRAAFDHVLNPPASRS